MRRFPVFRARVPLADVRVVVLVTVLAAGITVAVGHAQAPPPPAVFHTGATAGIIKDATKVGSTIYAVGTWVNSGAGGRIDAVLWTFDGASAPTRTALPDLTTGGASLNADAISPNAAYIASQARSNPAPTAVRVTRDSGANSLTALNLTPTTTFPTPAYAGGGRQARAVSDNGAVLYGQVNRLFSSNGTQNYQTRAMRFDVSGTTVTAMEIYPQPATNGAGYLTFQSILPGSTSTNAPWLDQQAFRYVHGSGATPVSPLSGGTWNAPLALTDDGKIILLAGPSTAFPNKELYLADYSTGSEILTPFGSPNEAWNFSGGGITGDGSVVAVTSSGGCSPAPCRYGYFHNSNGWFQLTTAMAAAGIDLTGWQSFQIVGIGVDGTMVWGSGLHNGAEEGYVVEFPQDFLKNFDVIPAPPADPSIIGVWAADGTGDPDTGNPAGVAVFMRDGMYYQIESTGFERGSYSFTGSSIQPVTRLDTNGDAGLSDGNGGAVSVSVNGDELRSPANCTFDPLTPDTCFVARRMAGAAGQIDGGWVLGDPTKADSSAVIVFTSSGKYFMAQDGDPGADPSGRDGIEFGQGTWDPATGIFGVSAISTDTNGEWGLSHSTGPVTAVLSADELALLAGDTTGTQTLTRIVDPATVVPAVNSASFTGTIGASFSQAVTASYALTFDASGLPSGLAIDSHTGVISGTPGAVGAFDATVTATNTFGGTGSATIHIEVSSIVCSAGSYLAAPADVACTPAPAGSYVDTAGATSATLCPAGTFSAAEGAAACTPAPADTYVPVTGATSATPCPAGLSSDPGATACDDRTAPVISGTPSDITVAPQGQTGAAVTWPAPTAIDSHDGAVAVLCTPASGSTFAKGTTQVTCTATDAAGNSDATSFYVTVGQPSPPSFTSVPDSQQVQATGPNGATVIYNPAPAAQDAFGQALPVICTPASGSTLPLGQTKVTCTATDANGLSASVQFTETVVDTLAPAFTFIPGPVLTVEATSNKGAVVSYQTPTVADLVDPLPTMKCDKASGQTYPIGNTIVSCTAADHSGNSTTQTFTISVADTTAPAVTLTKPVTGAIYRRGQKLAANYTCSDGGSGVSSCVGTSSGPSGTATVADGALINTSVAGNYTFTVVGTDQSLNARTVVVTYKVQ